jgi:hypothetical protein
MGAQDLLAELEDGGFSVRASNGMLVIRPWSKVTEPMRDALRAAKPELMALLTTPRPPTRRFQLPVEDSHSAHAYSWTTGQIAAFEARRDAILERGFSTEDAEDLAERLHLRDVTADPRRLCLECRHLSGAVGGWRCGNQRKAQVGLELPSELVTMGQDCPGFNSLRNLAPRSTA